MRRILVCLVLTLAALLMARGSALAAHSVTLTWTASSDGVANPSLAYNVYRGSATGAEATTPINASPVAAGCSGATCTWTDANVTTASTYFYTLKATLNGVSSAASNEVSCTIPLAAPSGLGAVAQ
jgi:hypothetical protein